MAKAKPGDFEHDVLAIIHTKQIGDNNKIELRVVKWKNSSQPTLEYRRMFFDKNVDEWKMRKQAGISIEEWKILMEHADEIKVLLEKTNG